MVGIPYAWVGVDEVGYYAACPICGLRCRAEGSIGESTLEDDVSKGASRAYGMHFERDHEAR